MTVTAEKRDICDCTRKCAPAIIRPPFFIPLDKDSLFRPFYCIRKTGNWLTRSETVLYYLPREITTVHRGDGNKCYVFEQKSVSLSAHLTDVQTLPPFPFPNKGFGVPCRIRFKSIQLALTVVLQMLTPMCPLMPLSPRLR